MQTRGEGPTGDSGGFLKLEELPMCSFDGSSTRQAERAQFGLHASSPSLPFPDSTWKKNGVLVMCKVMMPDGKTPHRSNSPRATILDDPDAGVLASLLSKNLSTRIGVPLGFPREAFFRHPQGKLLHRHWVMIRVGCIARRVTWTRTLDSGALDAGINHEAHQFRSRQGPVGIPNLRQGLRKAPPTRCGWPATS